ncbi:hypothetical protein GCM10011611_60990 [Aliidongia dinghuensis]|uniref:Uncharacterized protein n=1 Tax=Aliidongia dinghuensis TaxID=1867774 RepID=A0A8J2YZJ8_9PROT|nr:hypothetical protein GCM10011611_60990 [Aliidongia dinghuensis]
MVEQTAVEGTGKCLANLCGAGPRQAIQMDKPERWLSTGGEQDPEINVRVLDEVRLVAYQVAAKAA